MLIRKTGWIELHKNCLQNIRDDGHKFNLVHQTKAKPPEIKEINTEETTDRQKTFADANDNASISDITEKQPSIVVQQLHN